MKRILVGQSRRLCATPLPSLAVLLACSVFLPVSPLPAQESADAEVEPSIFDLVTECDLLAAHPDDPERLSDGVTDEEIVPRLAIMACEDAREADPDDPRFAFQLGRAQLALGREEAARAYFEEAAEDDYAAAWGYLGDFYQFGRGGLPADREKALEYYRNAVEGEFLIAQGQVDQLRFDPTLFVSGLINLLYRTEFDEVMQQSDALTRNYLFNFVSTAQEECGRFLEPGPFVSLYIYRYPDDWTIEDEEDINIAIQTSIGEADAGVFLERHGCEGPVAGQLFGNINSFFGSL